MEAVKLNETNEADNQYLTFILDKEEFGVDILSVQELRGWENATPMPNSPDWIEGVINLRGVIVPIVCLRKRFGLESREACPTTVVVIVKVATKEQERVVGIVVDAVSEVYNVNAADLQPAPSMDGAISIDFVKGLATIDDKMVILLDINKLINEGVLAVDAEAGAAEAA
ncbi:MAG: chemotaxis protein CheW [Mariprofundaceae bacterium]